MTTDIRSSVASLFPPPNVITYNPLAGAGFPVGSPVAQSPSSDPGIVVVAQAGTETSAVVGFATFPGTTNKRCRTQFLGPLTLTTEQWDLITGGSGGLETGAVYYLSTVAGQITTDDVSAVRVGVALGPDTLMIQLGGQTDSASVQTIAAGLVSGIGGAPAFVTNKGFSAFGRNGFNVYELTLDGAPPPDTSCIVLVTLCSMNSENTHPQNVYAQVSSGVVLINFYDTVAAGNVQADFYVTVLDGRSS